MAVTHDGWGCFDDIMLNHRSRGYYYSNAITGWCAVMLHPVCIRVKWAHMSPPVPHIQQL